MTAAALLTRVWTSPENLGHLFVNLLAIGGGFLVGYVGCGLLLRFAARALAGRKVPLWILFFTRVAAGVVVAWLVALFVFSSGGGGGLYGGGGGAGDGTGATGTAAGSTSRATPPEKGTTSDGVPGKRGTTVRVEVLGFVGGERVTDQQFYRVEGEPERLGLKELGLVLERLKKDNPRLKEVEIVIYQNSPAQDHHAVTDAVDVVRGHGLTPNMFLDQGKSP